MILAFGAIDLHVLAIAIDSRAHFSPGELIVPFALAAKRPSCEGMDRSVQREPVWGAMPRGLPAASPGAPKGAYWRHAARAAWTFGRCDRT